MLAVLAGCRAIRNDYESDDGGVASDGGDAGRGPIVNVAGVVVATLAGGAGSGGENGTGPGSSFANPAGLLVDDSGAILVTEYGGGRLRKVTAAGASSLVASGLGQPFGVAASAGTTYVTTDLGAGGATPGGVWRIEGAGAKLVAGGFARPRGLVALADGRLLVADREKNTLSLVDPTNSSSALLAGAAKAFHADGVGAAARFAEPIGLAVLPDGAIVVADAANDCIRRVTVEGVVTTFAGDGTGGMFDATDKLLARFSRPIAVAADYAGNVYVSDSGNHRIRRIDVSGVVDTIAGDGVQGIVDGDGAKARFGAQQSIAVSPDGKTLYVSDGGPTDGDAGITASNRIRKITLP